MRRGGVAAAAAALALAGCAPATHDSARVVADDEVPFELLEPAAPATTTSSAVPSRTGTIYLVDDEGLLVPATRQMARIDADSLLDELAAEPTESEVGRGLRTLLDSEDEAALVLGVNVGRGVATVDLGPEFAELDGDSQLLALAQLVFTLTGQPGVGQVAFTIAGSPVDVPRADGTTTGDPVTADDFASLIAP